ncbi:MAG: DUF3786 domain-containing protein [Desulfobacterales bacterium]|nr:DUF3786 domain-containing protein [Desulfobacterales bacterium]
MSDQSPVFKKTYKDYMAQVARLDLKSVEQKLGVQVEGNEVVIPLLGEPYRVSEKDIIGPSGEKASFDICIILFKYLLLCPDMDPKDKEWVTYRDIKDAGPLTAYFINDVEQPVSSNFAGRLSDLEKASKALGGYPPNIELPYDLSVQFDLLPRIPVLVLFNDRDDEFPAKCSVLFERRVRDYLDAECIAIAGRLVANNLISFFHAKTQRTQRN